MKTLIKILFILFFGIIQINYGQITPQESIYLNFYETFNNYSLVRDNNNNCCPVYRSNTNKYFPSSFFYQIKDLTRIFRTTKNDIPCVGVSIIDGGDQICGNSTADFQRSEIGLRDSRLAFHTTGNSYYKLKFFIDRDFVSNNHSDEYTIFQIIPSGNFISNNSHVKLVLPQFLMQIMPVNSTTHDPSLQFNYGLEFALGHCYACQLDSLQHANIDETYYACGEGTKRKQIISDIDYGWNEILFQIQWSEFYYGWMDIWVNGIHVNSPDGENHTFIGNNIYNNSMIPYYDNSGQTYYGDSRKFINSIKFGNYYYGDRIDNTIYFEYFYADSERYNIDHNFKTNIKNDSVGVLNLKENIECNEVHNADEFIFLFEDFQTGQQQYLGNLTDNPHILDYDRLLDILNLEFYKEYKVAVRARFFDGFNGKYSNPKIIRLEPDTNLISEFCGGNLSINHNQTLKVEKIKGADGYELYFQEEKNPSNEFYQFVPSSGEILVQSLFDLNPNLLNDKKYIVKARARFQQYGMEGRFSAPCTVKFIDFQHPQPEDEVKFYPNPFINEINFTNTSRISEVQISDIHGSLLKVFKNLDNKNINLSDLKNGMYFLTIKEKEKNRKYKIIKL